MLRSTGLLIAICCLSSGVSAQSDLGSCRQLTDNLERVACYDLIVDQMQQSQTMPLRSDELTRAQSNRKPEESSRFVESGADQLKSESKTTSAFGLPPEKRDLSTTQRSSVSRIDKNAHGKLVVHLANGQVWRQLDSSRLPVRSGEDVVIRSASLGSHLLEKASGSRKIRVKRIH